VIDELEERRVRALGRQADALERAAEELAFQSHLLTHLADLWTPGRYTDETLVEEIERFRRVRDR